MDYKYTYGDNLKVTNISNEIKANHLMIYIGQTGEVISRIALTKVKHKYKLRFKDGETHYFNENELEKIH